jgi:hypothetical protein
LADSRLLPGNELPASLWATMAEGIHGEQWMGPTGVGWISGLGRAGSVGFAGGADLGLWRGGTVPLCHYATMPQGTLESV